MEKVCPRCKYPQEGIYKCEYCGLVFAQYNKTQITKRSNWQNAIDKKSSTLNIMISLIALIGLFGLVYFWYQHESAKRMAELEEIRKLKISEQKRKEKQQLIIERQQQNTEKEEEKERDAVLPVNKTLKKISSATTREQQNIEREKKKAVSPVNKIQKKTLSITTKVVCRKFDVNTVLKGKEIKFWLNTDLPNDTIVMVSVSRPYWQKGSSATYYGSYYAKRSFVRELNRPVTVIIDDNEWRRQIEKKHKLITSVGESLQVSTVSDKVELNLTVSVDQDNPAFGRRNANLEGTMVKADHGFRIIREEKTFLIPYGIAESAAIRTKTTRKPRPKTRQEIELYR